MEATEPQDEFTLVSAPESNRYEIHDGDAVAGFAEYTHTPDQVVFTHTVVKPEYRGQGLAERLARFALDDAVTTGKRIVPVCTYIAAFVRKNHDWDEHLEPSGSSTKPE